jgi:hypothetical protein
VNDTLADTDTTMMIDTVSLPKLPSGLVPVGARFTVVGSVQEYTITGRTPPSTGPTTDLTFTPALATADGIPADDAVITFLPQKIEIKVGDGDISWTETQEVIYDLDRTLLDSVRLGDEQPVEVDLSFTFDEVSASSGQAVTPVDALKKLGEASEWVTASDDPCEPYAVNIRAVQCVPCGTVEDQEFLFKDFRYTDLEFSIEDALISVSGSCNITSVPIIRSTNTDC